MGRVKRIWNLSPMRAAKVQASLRIRAVSPEPPLLAHTSSESRGTFRQTARSLAPLNGWACAVTICHDGMLEDTNSLDGAQMLFYNPYNACEALRQTDTRCYCSYHSISIVKKMVKDGQSGILMSFDVKKQKSTLAAYGIASIFPHRRNMSNKNHCILPLKSNVP